MPDQYIYHDRFEEKKIWDKLLFLARPLQAAEMNELQTLFHEKIRRLSDVFISDGSVIKGCDIILPDSYPGTLQIAEGQIYLKGSIVHVPKQGINGQFTGKGIEQIYLDSVNEVLTEENDPDYTDPSEGTPNAGLPGAHRGIIRISFYSEEEKSDTCRKFDFIYDGKILFKPSDFGGDKIVSVMEKRTYDVSGDFFVEGAEIQLQTNEDDSSKYDIIISPYNSYLNGRQFNTVIAQIETIDKSIAVRDKDDFYTISQAKESSDDLTNNVFTIGFPYVKIAHTCTYPVKRTISVTHTGPGSLDEMGLDGTLVGNGVKSITKDETTYVEGFDYTVNYVDGAIDWSPSGNEPSTGVDYDVECIYYRVVDIRPEESEEEEGEALKDIGGEEEASYQEDRYMITYDNEDQGEYMFASLVIKDPDYYSEEDTLTINLDYTTYKYRLDLVTIDKETGMVVIFEGEYTNRPPCPLPNFAEHYTPIYTIMNVPGAYSDPSMFDVEDKRTIRITQDGIKNMSLEIEQINYRHDLTILDISALRESVTGVKQEIEGLRQRIGATSCGDWTDSFDTEDNADMDYDGSNLLFPDPCLIGFDDGCLVLPIVINESVMDPIMLSSELVTGKNFRILPFTEELLSSQLLASEGMSVNPYSVPYIEASVNLDPKEDIWTETKNIEVIKPGIITSKVTKRISVTGNVFRRQRRLDLVRGVVGQQTQRVRGRGNSLQAVAKSAGIPYGLLQRRGRGRGIESRGRCWWRFTANFSYENKRESTKVLLGVSTKNTVIRYARQRKVSIDGQSWYVPGDPTTYKLKFFMGGKKITKFIDGNDVEVDVPKLQQNYSFDGRFVIPPGVKTGIAPVKITASLEPEQVVNNFNISSDYYHAHGATVIKDDDGTYKMWYAGYGNPGAGPIHKSFDESNAVQGGLYGYYYDSARGHYPQFDYYRYKQVDSTINFNWGSAGPNPGQLGYNRFSIMWIGWVNIPSDGIYGFGTHSDDSSMVFIDGKIVVNNEGNHGRRWREGKITLTTGLHKIQVTYHEWYGADNIDLQWNYGGNWNVIPSNYLYHDATGSSGSFSGVGGLRWRVCYCDSDDGITWKNHQMVINARRQGYYDYHHSYEPCVIKDGGVYKMWYTAHRGHTSIVYCESQDGINWSSFQLAVSWNSQGYWDNYHAYSPTVIKEDNGVYKMWYAGYCTRRSPHRWSLIYCESTNGINWTGYQSVIKIGSAGKWDKKHLHEPCVIKDGQKYKMWYTAISDRHRTVYCDSDDGIHWYNFKLVIREGFEGVHDKVHAYLPTIIKEDGAYRMWYTAHRSIHTSIVHCVSMDGKNWSDFIDASVNYVSEGTLTTNTSHYRLDQTVYLTKVNFSVTWRDPLAESMLFEHDVFISSVGVFFQNKSSWRGVSLEIVSMVNGYPSQNTLASTHLNSDQVSISWDASAETRFTFSDPVYLPKGTEFCIVLRSPSDQYMVWIARQGQKEIGTNKIIMSQPYQGVMFKSQNGSTWTADQMADIKFKIYRAKFVTEEVKELLFEEQEIDDSWMMVAGKLQEPEKTACRFQYRISGEETWNDLEFGEKYMITEEDALVQKCQFRALLVSESDMVSPIFNKGSVGTLYWRHSAEGYYYSDLIDMKEDNEFDMVKITLNGQSNSIPFEVSLIVSSDKDNWFKYEGSQYFVRKTPMSEEADVGAFSYDYNYDLRDNFPGPNPSNLARYCRVCIKLGSDTHSGYDTPLLFDLKVKFFESL